MVDNVQQRLGAEVSGWCAPPLPQGDRLTGRFAELMRLDPAEHAHELYSAYVGSDQVWDYLGYGPFATLPLYLSWMEQTVADPAHVFHAIRNRESGRIEGVASFLRMDPANGVIEVGHITYSPALQRTRAATEAMFLMMNWAFTAGYRRYEWKCNALNVPSRRAAQRLGFSFEGIFRQAMVVKGRNRDTAWFSIIDSEWPALKTAHETWLSDENFDAQGRQKQRLGDLTTPHRAADDPGA